MNQRSKLVFLVAAGAVSVVMLVAVGSVILKSSPLQKSTAGASTAEALSGAKRIVAQLTSLIGPSSRAPSVIGNWPPVEGERFPDLVLPDQNGELVRLSDFEGQLILVEYAAVPCHGCQAFAGGKDCGAFGGYQVQPGLDSIETYAKQFANVRLGEDVVFVQVLLYGNASGPPTAQQVAGWAEHFGMDRENRQIVLQGDSSLLSQEVFDMIPGFHLIDRQFTLRSDSCGHHPKRDLYRDLLPLLGKLASASSN
ncbi:TlpA family protein disulfide reductase [Roseiconus lacunae]|uniref:Thioredoxin domain-containing protein n=1 Tax=Roseiconus lacunae TaxID=2605694 RepID=A0ABT7PLA4_9BACT|nr:hypothetical protein [Roseiconus lacunae]MDM4017292.1 hypothetical protein [Roseiconus lacunae]